LSKTYRSGQSVYDEPDIFPGRTGEILDADWRCDHCGYNLRGRPLEAPCPECGQRTYYRPPPPEADSYRSWLTAHLARRSVVGAWPRVIAVALAGGPWAVLAVLTQFGPTGAVGGSVPLMTIVFAPVIEETMKIALAGYIVEMRPYLFFNTAQIRTAAVGSALAFAVLENLAYLHIYTTNPSATLMLWRWLVCTGVHLGCTAVAAQGLILVWQRTMEEYREPRIGSIMPWLAAAMVLHGMYNAAVVGLSGLF
jgi:hypothetical protein